MMTSRYTALNDASRLAHDQLTGGSPNPEDQHEDMAKPIDPDLLAEEIIATTISIESSVKLLIEDRNRLYKAALLALPILEQLKPRSLHEIEALNVLRYAAAMSGAPKAEKEE